MKKKQKKIFLIYHDSDPHNVDMVIDQYDWTLAPP